MQCEDVAPFPKAAPSASSDMHWEWRHFWPEADIITLHGLPESFLNPSMYRIKHREDDYYILAHHPLNIKCRKGKLMYKPQVKEEQGLLAFSKKIQVDENAPDIPLLGTTLSTKALLQAIDAQGIPLRVEKEALIYKQEGFKFEISKLCIAKRVYWSASVESPCHKDVLDVSQRVFHGLPNQSYVQFLQHEVCPS